MILNGKAGPPPDMVASGMWLGGKAGAGAVGFYLLGLAVWSSMDTTVGRHAGGLAGLDREFFLELLYQFVTACVFMLFVGVPVGLAQGISLGVVTGGVIGESLKRMWAFMTVRDAWLVGSLVCMLAAFLIDAIAAAIFLLPYAPRIHESSFLPFCRMVFGTPSLIYLSIGGWLSAWFYSQMKKQSL